MFGQMPPWMQGMGQGQQMTPGSGMPPYRNAPMNMQAPQMAPPSSIPGMPPPQQPQQPINPAQMGMLSSMLASQTRQPGQTPGGMGSLPGAAAQHVLPGAAAQPAGAAGPGGIDPMQLGMLSQMLGLARGPFG